MNLTSLYKRRFTKDTLSKYTHSAISLILLRLTGKMPKENLGREIDKLVNKFFKKYGE